MNAMHKNMRDSRYEKNTQRYDSMFKGKNKGDDRETSNENIKRVIEEGFITPEVVDSLNRIVVSRNIQKLSYSSFRKHYDAFLKVYLKLKQQNNRLNKDLLVSELTRLYLLARYDEHRSQGGLSNVRGFLSGFLKNVRDTVNKSDKDVNDLLDAVKMVYETFIILIRANTSKS